MDEEIKQKTLRVHLPQFVEARDDINFSAYYDHFDRNKVWEYTFKMCGNFVNTVEHEKHIHTFVLPNFKEKTIHTIVNGAFVGVKDATLIVTGSKPIVLCKSAFEVGANVKVVLPKDMSLFHVRQKAIGKNGIVTLDFAVLAKSKFNLSDDDFVVTKVENLDDEKLPFKISVDKTKSYNRTCKTLEEMGEALKSMQRSVEQKFEK